MHRLSGEVVDAICKQSETRSHYMPSLLPADGASVSADHHTRLLLRFYQNCFKLK